MIFLIFSLLLCISSPISSAEKTSFHSFEAGDIDLMSEEEKISLLKSAAEHAVSSLQSIQNALDEFHKQEKICIDEKNSCKESDNLFELSKRAFILDDLIREKGFELYFKKEFLDQLGILGQAYKKKAIPSTKIL